MLKFGVTTQGIDISKELDKLANDQVPFATSLALNRCAQLARTTLQNTMRRVFDRPTPFVLNSTFTQMSSKRDLSVVIGHKLDTSKRLGIGKYITTEIEGGPRNMRDSEKFAFGKYWVPSSHIKMNQYGGVGGGEIKKILSELGIADHHAGYSSNRTAKSAARQKRKGKYRDVFMMRPGNARGLKPGVYQRKGTTIIPLLFFLDRAPTYKPTYDMYGVVKRVFDSEYDKQFKYALDYALSTAKR